MGFKVEKFTTGMFRVSFPKVFRPDPNSGDKYSLMAMIKKTGNQPWTSAPELKPYADAVKKAFLEKWPLAKDQPKNWVNPIKDGDTAEMQDGSLRTEKYPEIAGHWYLTASSKSKPGLIDNKKNAILTDDEFYGGCFARATMHAYAYSPSAKMPQSKIGVAFGLDNIQKLSEGERFSGRTKAEDDFDAVAEISANDDVFGTGAAPATPANAPF